MHLFFQTRSNGQYVIFSISGVIPAILCAFACLSHALAAVENAEPPTTQSHATVRATQPPVMTWKQLNASAKRILEVTIPANDTPEAKDRAAVICSIKRDLKAEAARAGKTASDNAQADPNAKPRAAESVILDLSAYYPPPGVYLAYLRERSPDGAKAWKVRPRQSLYPDAFTGAVFQSLLIPEKLADTRYLSSEDRHEALQRRMSTSLPASARSGQTAPHSAAASPIILTLTVQRDKFDAPGHGLARFTLKNTGTVPLAIYTGIGATWTLTLSGGVLKSPVLLRPGYDADVMRGGLDPAAIATRDDFTIIQPRKEYSYDVFLTPNLDPVLATLRSDITIKAGYENRIAALSDLVSPQDAHGYPAIWTGFIMSAPITVDLHSDRRKAYLDKMKDKDPQELIHFQTVNDLDIPANVKLKPPADGKGKSAPPPAPAGDIPEPAAKTAGE